MRDLLRVSAIRFMAAPRADRPSGLFGWVSFVIDSAIHVDGVAVRKTREGTWALAFPDRRDRSGVAHCVVRPLNQAARTSITEQVIEHLRRGAYVP